ncbi:dUTP diphosphatase [Miniphocaeibacter halophilus]|uniref:dUTP diphosphatase n=1 Tax=Miniphocaeibacter halophilus TaxID=2931922 RepID=A0AC61MTA0_9FIRM|nr:dUTP diphosphatase [Miniphocaeibacter halophilus]QQK07624.1 dUTP diphosphatase [Miniphocaeibacter halophilus]
MKIKIINKSNNSLPEYATLGSAGLDLQAYLPEPLTLKSLERKIIPTGLYMSIPVGYEVQVRARSGMAIKHGITVINGIGTIDSDYRGEIGVLLVNLSKDDYTINSGDKIAQMILSKYEQVEFELVENLDNTERNAGGFGHTGY